MLNFLRRRLNRGALFGGRGDSAESAQGESEGYAICEANRYTLESAYDALLKLSDNGTPRIKPFDGMHFSRRPRIQ